VPDTWTPVQIAQFQAGWDAMFEGNTGARRHMKFVPGDASKVLMLKGAEALLKSEFDEWIARIICYAFSVSPQPFVKMMNRATAQTAVEEARAEGLEPMMDYLKDMMDDLIVNCMGVSGVQFKWNMEEEEDAVSQSQIDDTYMAAGVYGIDDVRKRMGLEALNIPVLITTPKGPIPVSAYADGTWQDIIMPAPTSSGDDENEDDDEEDDEDSEESNSDGGSAKEESGNAQKFRKANKRFSYAALNKGRFAAKPRKDPRTRSSPEDRLRRLEARRKG